MKSVTVREFYHNAGLVDGLAEGRQLVVTAKDLFHVAIALEVAADGFPSFDADQNLVAEAAGLPLIALAPSSQ